MHRELQAALRSALSYGSIDQGRLVDVHASTAWSWCRTRRGALTGCRECRREDTVVLVSGEIAQNME